MQTPYTDITDVFRIALADRRASTEQRNTAERNLQNEVEVNRQMAISYNLHTAGTTGSSDTQIPLTNGTRIWQSLDTDDAMEYFRVTDCGNRAVRFASIRSRRSFSFENSLFCRLDGLDKT